MNIALYVRPNNDHQATVESLLNQHELPYQINPRNTESFTHAVSLGGDGTFLSAVRTMGSSLRLPLMGVNSGRLGFLATVRLSAIEDALECLKRGEYLTERRAMISADNVEGCNGERTAALNEFTIQKSGTSMIEIEMWVDGVLAASYWADGVIVSTPTGSTAYSMSVSGAILVPGCRCFVVSPIAPHNLSLRPLVVSDDVKLTLTVRSRTGSNSICTLDNREYTAPSGTSYELYRSDDYQEIITLAGNNFYETLREKLLWGVDLRN